MVIAATLASDSSAVDVGAAFGAILEGIVAAAPEGRHWAYEPIPHLAADLGRRFPRANVTAAAVAEEPGHRTFYRDADHSAASSLYPELVPERKRRPIEVPVVTLDEDLPADVEPALIKIDVEGGELAVLEGARHTLERARPVVVFEHGAAGLQIDPTSSERIHGLLSDCGMRVFDIEGEGPYDRGQFAEIVRAGRLWVFIAHPE